MKLRNYVTTIVALSALSMTSYAADSMKDMPMNDKNMKGMEMKDKGMMNKSGTADGAMAEGEVRKVDKVANKITLRHGPIKSLGMPGGMSMAFRVSDPAMLNQVKEGDKVKFVANKVDGAYTVTKIEPAK